MRPEQEQYQKNIIKELMAIRKNLEIMSHSAMVREKAELVKLGLSSLSEAFPEYGDESDYPDHMLVVTELPKPVKDDGIIAVDFDGTLCENRWPDIGAPITPVIEYVKYRQRKGARLILWTNRVGEPLENAIAWCKEMGIVLSAVNENLPDIIEAFGGDCRKIFANEYLDDRAVLPNQVIGENRP